jgi:IclR family KDG regulon transcriptional repressor
MPKRREKPGEVQAVARTLRILEVLAAEGELGLTDLAARVGVHKSTLYRFMCTLCDLGYVRRDPDTERFSLRLKIFEIGSSVYARLDLVKLASPTLERLSSATQETVHLAILDDGQLVYLSKIESKRSLRVSMQSRVGLTAPAYCTGVGKVLLAWAQTSFLDAYLKRCEFIRYTEKTIPDRLRLAAELQAIRNRGWAVDDEEHEYGVRCVAAPVREKGGGVVAALSIAGPTVRMGPDRLGSIRTLVCEAADELSAALGYSVPRPGETGGQAGRTEQRNLRAVRRKAR